jgi:hypothetical protein
MNNLFTIIWAAAISLSSWIASAHEMNPKSFLGSIETPVWETIEYHKINFKDILEGLTCDEKETSSIENIPQLEYVWKSSENPDGYTNSKWWPYQEDFLQVLECRYS